MSETGIKRERMVTPIGEAKWAHLHIPKPPYKGGGNPKYQIDVYFNKDDPEWSAWAKDVMDKIRLLPDQVDRRTGQKIPKQISIKRELDENDQPTNRFYVTFKTSAKFKPMVFDSEGNRLDENILVGNGSKVKVSYVENVYSEFGGGLNFYLNAVQVFDLVEYKAQGAESYGFGVNPKKDAPTGPSLGDEPPDFDNDLSF